MEKSYNQQRSGERVEVKGQLEENHAGHELCKSHPSKRCTQIFLDFVVSGCVETACTPTFDAQFWDKNVYSECVCECVRVCVWYACVAHLTRGASSSR